MNPLKHLYFATLRRITWTICYCLPIQKKRIVVSSYYGQGYGDNPKYIVNELLKNSVNCEIIWVLKNKELKKTLPPEIKFCIRDSVSHIYYMATARIWIDNCRSNPRYKRKDQFYIQSWHGFALKKIEKDVCNVLSKDYVKQAIKDSKFIDVIIADSIFMKKIYSDSFWYNGKIELWGSPRTDILLKRNEYAVIRSKIDNYFTKTKDKRIVLYAPTFRSNLSTACYLRDFQRILEALNNKFKSSHVVLSRLHPNLTKLSSLASVGKALNATDYPDIQELLLSADIVISDYSSLIFDFMITRRPVFLFTPDFEEYKNDRGVYFEPDELPFKFNKTLDELIQEINTFEKDVYLNKVCIFIERNGMCLQGNSSKKCVDLINSILEF